MKQIYKHEYNHEHIFYNNSWTRQKYRYIKEIKTYKKHDIEFTLYFNNSGKVDIIDYNGIRYFVDSIVSQKLFEEKLSECDCKYGVEMLVNNFINIIQLFYGKNQQEK